MWEDRTLDELLLEAQALGWARFGKRVVLCLPGMFRVDGLTGRYPAISITGGLCELGCDHCKGKILKPMKGVSSARELVEECLGLEEQGAVGCLLTGGSDKNGRLPWMQFMKGIEVVKTKTRLHVSVHSGMVDRDVAQALKDAGVDQALVDVVGSSETWTHIMHLEGGESLLMETLDALYGCGLQVVPHIVAGIHGGRIVGEMRALEILKDYPVQVLVWVAFMPLKDTPLGGSRPASPEEVGRLMAISRLIFPNATINLGCARPRGKPRLELERLALRAGLQRLAVYTEETVNEAKGLGLDVLYSPACCSVGMEAPWIEKEVMESCPKKP